jgi:hypothetical protein
MCDGAAHSLCVFSLSPPPFVHYQIKRRLLWVLTSFFSQPLPLTLAREASMSPSATSAFNAAETAAVDSASASKRGSVLVKDCLRRRSSPAMVSQLARLHLNAEILFFERVVLCVARKAHHLQERPAQVRLRVLTLAVSGLGKTRILIRAQTSPVHSS